jgi:hypothetical protein
LSIPSTGLRRISFGPLAMEHGLKEVSKPVVQTMPSTRCDLPSAVTIDFNIVSGSPEKNLISKYHIFRHLQTPRSREMHIIPLPVPPRTRPRSKSLAFRTKPGL